MDNLKDLTSEELVKEISRRFEDREQKLVENEKMIEEMEKVNKDLLKSEENKSKFMSLIKNEFNNPLFSIMSLTKNLLNKSNDVQITKIGELLEKEALSLNFQIKNIMTGSDIESGTIQIENSQINILELIEQIKEELKYVLLKKEIEIIENINIENDFLGDREKIYLVIINILSNAIEFSPRKSKVEITINETEELLNIKIKDNGEGIKEEEKENIFKRFYQAHSGENRECRGQGLGLSIVRDLIEMLEGNLNFDSKFGEYTSFELTFVKKEGEDQMFEDDIFFDDFGDDEEF